MVIVMPGIYVAATYARGAGLARGLDWVRGLVGVWALGVLVAVVLMYPFVGGAPVTVVPRAARAAPGGEDLRRDVVGGAPGPVDDRHAGELAHPGELAARVVARAALHLLDVARRAGPRSPAPCARCPRRRRVRARGPRPATPSASIWSTRASMRVIELLALHHQADQQRRCGGRRPSTAAIRRRAARARRRRAAPARGRSAGGRWVRSSRPPTARVAARIGVQGGRTAALELGHPALAHALGRGGPQAQLGQRGAQVEAGAADDDRPPPGRQQAVDLGVRELGVLAGAEAWHRPAGTRAAGARAGHARRGWRRR